MSPIVQSLWIGSRLPAIQRLGVQSFLEQGHDYHLYAYEQIEGVPEGTTVRSASNILPRESVFCYQEGVGKGSFSAFSNLFRYKLLFEKGGWWVDTDVVCLKPFEFDDEFIFATEYKEDGTTLAASCVIKSPAGSDYLDYCLRVCDAKDKTKIIWGELGPRLLDDAINRFGLSAHRVAAQVFNPINWFEFSDIVKPEFDLSQIGESHAVHLWNQMWKIHNLDPEHDGPPQSLYALLRKRYLDSATRGVDTVTRFEPTMEFHTDGKSRH